MINFIKRNDNYFIEGCTEKGTQIYFVEIPENKLSFYVHEEFYKNTGKTTNAQLRNKDNEPTRIVIYSNITISDRMLEVLEQSKIIKIVLLCNNNQQIVAYPLIGFNYNKPVVHLSNSDF